MPRKFAFACILFSLLVVITNIIYFHWFLETEVVQPRLGQTKPQTSKIISNIFDHHTRLPSHFKIRNARFFTVQKEVIGCFNSSHYTEDNIWEKLDTWSSTESLFPLRNGLAAVILEYLRKSSIQSADNARKGTQLKLLLHLENKQKLYFKPKRYNHDYIIHGDVYAGFDRHNSEVFAYYLAIVLNFTWIAPVVTRRVHLQDDIIPVATTGLQNTMLKDSSGSLCVFGKCFYCKRSETVCEDHTGHIEGAAILLFNGDLQFYLSPWRRSYTSKKRAWEIDDDFCKKTANTLSKKRLLDLVDTSIFDFLIQNGDRHRYEVYMDRIVLLDNGKGLGNPHVDAMDILAPLYQCCLLRASTWQRLELLTGGALTETIKAAASLQGERLTTDAHYEAIERRLLLVYATVQYCVSKHGSAKVWYKALCITREKVLFLFSSFV